MKQSDHYKLRNHGLLITLFILITIGIGNGVERNATLFVPGKEYVYIYKASSSSGVLLPATASSGWEMRGRLVAQAEEESVLMRLQSLKISTWNGIPAENSVEKDIGVEELYKPFRITYQNGQVKNFSVQSEPIWVTNMKRSIAGIFQINATKLRQENVFTSIEDNHYGQCNVEYVVVPEYPQKGDNRSIQIVRKSIDPSTCRGHPARFWSNVPRMTCAYSDQNPVLKSSERLYRIEASDENDTITVLYVNATGGIYVQPFQSPGEAQFLFTKQEFELIDVRDATERMESVTDRTVNLQHELPENDFAQYNNAPSKQDVFKSIERLLDRLSSRLENPGLDVKVEHLHNTTISTLLYYMGMLERDDLQKAYIEISGTSYKEETIRNLFLEALPQVGSRDAALFVLDLIQRKQVSDIIAVQLLTHLPFHVRKPDVELLVDLQVLLTLPEGIPSEVQNTAILTYGTLIYKTCLLYCPYEMLDDYVRLYLDKFTESKQYEKKMVWLQGLANIQLGKVVEFLEPIARGDNSDSRHLRFLASWASLPAAPFRPDLIHPVYWPILVNRSEPLELRIAALTLLVVSSPSSSRLITLYWYIQSEPNQHLYNFFYTTLKSMERTNFPCYAQLGSIAAQFMRVLKPPVSKQRLLTGNYLLDYQDTYRHFGAMIQAVIIANPVSNVPIISFMTLNNHGVGINLNQVSLFIRAEGVLEKLTPIQESGDILELLKQFRVKQQTEEPVHVEIIAQIQGKSVLCLHLNETNIKKGYKFLMDLTEYAYIFQNMAFHINQQRINVPLSMESVQVTDLGTDARLAVTVTSMFSMRGNFTYIPLGRNNHVILRSSVHGMETIETYNPLTDLWHGAERAQSVHAYLPINVTIGLDLKLFFSYVTPTEFITTGLTAHVRTSTNIRGARVRAKLDSFCPNCTALFTVQKNPDRKSKEFTILQVTTPELGGQLNVRVFDCENFLTRDRLVADVVSSHRSNHQIWPAIKTGILGFHFFDYFTYVPPGGSCGLAAHVEPYDLESTEVKVEYSINEDEHVISLSRRPVGSETVLQRWKLTITYDIFGLFKDSLIMRASKFESEEEVWESFLEVESSIPWDQHLLSITPSSPASLRLSIGWRALRPMRGKPQSFLSQIQLIGEVTDEQIQAVTSDGSSYKYEECQRETYKNNFVPYKDICYEISKELSTLRKYEMKVSYADLPESLSTWARKLRAVYELMGGNSSVALDSTNFTLGVVFPKDSNTGTMHLNEDVISFDFNANIIDSFLMRTRHHRIMDNWLTQTFMSTCTITPWNVTSAYGLSSKFPSRGDETREKLALGHCRSSKPGFAVTYADDSRTINVTIYAGSETIRIVSEGDEGTLYRGTKELYLAESYKFREIEPRKLYGRIYKNTVAIVYLDITLLIHWTPQQVILFYPTYVNEFSCGGCTQRDSYDVRTA